MKADEIDAEIRITATRRRLPAAHLERWLAMDHESRGAILALARKLGLRTGQIVSALELLEEIAVRERTTVAEVLGHDEIRRIADAPGSAPARASAFLVALRQLRYPRLKKMQARLRAEIAALKLPGRISVDLPKELGSDELLVSLRVRTGDELRTLVAALNRSCAGLERIIETLGCGGSPGDDDENEI
jgi:hypothetical protein